MVTGQYYVHLSTAMDRDEDTKLQHRKKYAKVACAVIIAAAFAVGLTFGVKRRQERKDLNVACTFLGVANNLKFCLDNTNFANAYGVFAPIPSELGLLTQVTSLKFEGDVLVGTIPSTLGNLIKLADLTIWNTQLTGTLPSTLGNLSQLKILRMNGNPKLTGPIPSTLGNLTLLEWLYIGDSQLSGTIPLTLGNLVQLEELYMYQNQKLSGTIPSTFGNLVNLSSLNLGSNQLTGTIPSTMASLTRLQYLHLRNNTQLGGTVPSSLCSASFISFEVDCDKIACSCCTTYHPENDTLTNCSVS
jgi:Leucine rich repeat